MKGKTGLSREPSAASSRTLARQRCRSLRRGGTKPAGGPAAARAAPRLPIGRSRNRPARPAPACAAAAAVRGAERVKVHQDGLEAPLEQMTHLGVAPVVGLGADAVEMAHQQRQPALPGVQHKVIVLAHEAAGQHPGIKALHALRHHRQQGALRSTSSSKIGARRSPRELTW